MLGSRLTPVIAKLSFLVDRLSRSGCAETPPRPAPNLLMNAVELMPKYVPLLPDNGYPAFIADRDVVRPFRKRVGCDSLAQRPPHFLGIRLIEDVHTIASNE